MAAARDGTGLLTGLLRCGHCGRKLHVRYWGGRGTSARYLCKGDFDSGGDYCLGFGGDRVDRRIAEEVVQAISPLGVEASLKAIDRLTHHEDDRRQMFARQLQQLQYDAQRAFEQYNEVDPRNRLVADELERRWNAKLEQIEQVENDLARLEQQRPSLTDADQERLRALGENFGHVWNKACDGKLKKQIARTVIAEVIASDVDENTLRFVIHWKGALWPYIREFADNALTHVCKTLTKLTACGETCELYDIHGHYADAGEAAALMSYTLGVDMVLTGHSLGRNKLDHLLKSGGRRARNKAAVLSGAVARGAAN